MINQRIKPDSDDNIIADAEPTEPISAELECHATQSGSPNQTKFETTDSSDLSENGSDSTDGYEHYEHMANEDQQRLQRRMEESDDNFETDLPPKAATTVDTRVARAASKKISEAKWNSNIPIPFKGKSGHVNASNVYEDDTDFKGSNDVPDLPAAVISILS